MWEIDGRDCDQTTLVENWCCRRSFRRLLRGKIGVTRSSSATSVNSGSDRGRRCGRRWSNSDALGLDTDMVGRVKSTASKSVQPRSSGDHRRRHASRGEASAATSYWRSGRARTRARPHGWHLQLRISESKPMHPARQRLRDSRDPRRQHVPSITNVGTRPTFAESARSIEAHVFDFTVDIYGGRSSLGLVEQDPPRKISTTPTHSKHKSPKTLNRHEILAAAFNNPARKVGRILPFGRFQLISPPAPPVPRAILSIRPRSPTHPPADCSVSPCGWEVCRRSVMTFATTGWSSILSKPGAVGQILPSATWNSGASASSSKELEQTGR